MKLAPRLLLAFGTVLGMCLLSGVVALVKLSDTQANLEAVVTDGNVKLALSYEMSDTIHVLARQMRNLALISDAAQMQQEKR
jgi:methyl-accepting chemotaxis protein